MRLSTLSTLSLAIATTLPLAPAQATDLSLHRHAPAMDMATLATIEASSAIADIVNVPMPAPDLWERIRRGFSMPLVRLSTPPPKPDLAASKTQDVERISERALPYLYHVVEEVEKRKMPMEIALLPFIESAFNPHASSGSKAAGLWQFMPATGLAFKLRQDHYLDERRDLLASTDAALDYLERLHEMFGDWHLALAAYNWGEGSVQRAIKRNEMAGKPTDFASLAHLMPAETRNYVPKLQAVKAIIAQPEKYGVMLAHAKNEPYFTIFKKSKTIDVKTAARLAEMSVDEFVALNPQYKRSVIVGSADTRVLIPTSKAERFRSNLSSWVQAVSGWTRKKVTTAGGKINHLASSIVRKKPAKATLASSSQTSRVATAR